MKDHVVCTNCNEIVLQGEPHLMEGVWYCDACYDGLTGICEQCGCVFWQQERANDEINICQTCYEEDYGACDICQHVFPNTQLHEHEETRQLCCERCYEEVLTENIIHEYDYRPEPVFLGNGRRYFGVELEIDQGGKIGRNAKKLLEIANSRHEKCYIKADGSLYRGLEIVTHPMTLDYHVHNMPWAGILQTAIALGYQSHKTDTCGLHVHIDRNSLGDTNEEVEVAVARVLYFVERHWDELLRFSRRSEVQMKRWANRYGYQKRAQEILDNAKEACSGRYSCVNIKNEETIEFRIFRGTLKLNTLMATLQLVNAICDTAVRCDEEELDQLSWLSFVQALPEGQVPELITYLKERRLYVNEPIEQTEDE